MSGETVITIIGNTTSPAELRFTNSGAAVASFTVASTARVFDKQTGQWKDGDTLWLRCAAWRDLAENVAETITEKGMKVVVVGRLKSRSYETKEGEKRTVIELEVDECGVALSKATAVVSKRVKGEGGNAGSSAPAADAGGSWGGGWGNDSEAPF